MHGEEGRDLLLLRSPDQEVYFSMAAGVEVAIAPSTGPIPWIQKVHHMQPLITRPQVTLPLPKLLRKADHTGKEQ